MGVAVGVEVGSGVGVEVGLGVGVVVSSSVEVAVGMDVAVGVAWPAQAVNSSAVMDSKQNRCRVDVERKDIMTSGSKRTSGFSLVANYHMSVSRLRRAWAIAPSEASSNGSQRVMRRDERKWCRRQRETSVIPANPLRVTTSRFKTLRLDLLKPCLARVRRLPSKSPPVTILHPA